MDIYAQHRRVKQNNVWARQAAARLYGVKIPLHSQVMPMQDGSGAFVEVHVWVPQAEIDREGIPSEIPEVAPELSDDEIPF